MMACASAYLMDKRAPAQTLPTVESGVFADHPNFKPKFALTLDDFGGFEINRWQREGQLFGGSDLGRAEAGGCLCVPVGWKRRNPSRLRGSWRGW